MIWKMKVGCPVCYDVQPDTKIIGTFAAKEEHILTSVWSNPHIFGKFQQSELPKTQLDSKRAYINWKCFHGLLYNLCGTVNAKTMLQNVLLSKTISFK